jgi:dsRNA-specific ribonuclease
LDTQSNLKTEIKNQLIKWKKEKPFFTDCFSHTDGRNPKIALLGDKVIDVILYERLLKIGKKTNHNSQIHKEEIHLTKGDMDNKRQYYFSDKNQARIFDKLEIKNLLINQHQEPEKRVKSTVFEAIFGAVYHLFKIEKAREFFTKIAILMDYDELK